MGGSSGQSIGYTRQGANQGLANTQAQQSAQADPRLADLMNQYSQGKLSYQDVVKQAGALTPDTGGIDKQVQDLKDQEMSIGNNGDIPQQQREAMLNQLYDQVDTLNAQKASMGSGVATGAIGDQLALGSLTGNKFASEQVQNDPLYNQVFNPGYAQADNLTNQANTLFSQGQDQYGKSTSDLASDREALLGRDQSYGLNPTDLAAYGQASDNIARTSSSQQQSLAQALADRGLGASNNGAAAQGFSNLMGNQQEQLAQSQLQIAQNRINTAMNLAQTRSNVDLQRQSQAQQLGLGAGNLGVQAGNLRTGLGNLAKGAQSQYYNQNLAGSAQRQGNSAQAAQLTAGNQAQQQELLNELFSQMQQTKSPSFGQQIGSAFTNGVASSAGSIGAFPGKIINGVANSATKSAFGS